MGERARRSIMVVEDETAYGAVLRDWLSPHYEVRLSPDGAACFRPRADIPDLFLMDIDLPGEDGLTLCRRIRTSPRLAHVPVLFLSADRTTDTRIDGIEVGGSGFLTKPVERAVLLRRIEEVVGDAGARSKTRRGRS